MWYTLFLAESKKLNKYLLSECQGTKSWVELWWDDLGKVCTSYNIRRRFGLVGEELSKAPSLKGQVEKHFGNIQKLGFLLQNIQIINRRFSLFPPSFESYIYNLCVPLNNMNTDWFLNWHFKWIIKRIFKICP